MFVLHYKRDGEVRVVIRDGFSVAHARMMASFLEPGRFVDGRAIDKASAARLPRWVLGRVLTAADLASVAVGKKEPPATSVPRRRRPSYPA